MSEEEPVMFFLGEAFEIAYEWNRLRAYEHAICDRVMWHRIRQRGYSRHHVDRPSVCYRVSQPSIYRYFDEPPPVDADHDARPVANALTRWEEAGCPSLRFDLRARRATDAELHVALA